MWKEKGPRLRKYSNHGNETPKIKDANTDDKYDDWPPIVKQGTRITKPTTTPPIVNHYGLIITAICAVLVTVLIIVLIYFIIKKLRKLNSSQDQITDRTINNSNHNPYLPTYYQSSDINAHETSYPVYNVSCDRRLQYRQRYILQDRLPPITDQAPRHTQSDRIRFSDGRLLAASSPISSNNETITNPLYSEDSASEQESDIDNRSSIRDLYILTERSIRLEICGKLVVSVTHLVGHDGGVLYLDNMGISLKVPRGAINHGRMEIIFLVLNWDLSDNPEMKCDESLVSPVVYVGPHGLNLNKPCTLTFRHCSYNSRHIRVMRSETELHVQKDWNVMVDQDDVTGRCYFSPDECSIKINTFTLYTCVQAPYGDQIGKKWLQIAVFACPLRKENNHHQIRVYFLNKTPCALQWAIQNEAKFGGKMVCPEKVFLFDGNILDMFAKTRYISEQWELVEPDSLDKISFIKIWHGQCPHISVCYRRIATRNTYPSNRPVAIEMNLHLFTYQDTLEEDGQRVIIQICEDNLTPKAIDEPVCRRHHLDKIVIDVNSEECMCNIQSDQGPINTFLYGPSECHNKIFQDQCNQCEIGRTPSTFDQSVGSDSNETVPDKYSSSLQLVVKTNSGKSKDDRFDLDTENPVQRIPYALRKRLKLLLDAKHMFGSDWRDLANELDLNACIPILTNLESPTEKILDRAEQRGVTLEQLRGMFVLIEREDCVEEVDKFISSCQNIRTPIENADSSLFSRKENVGSCQRAQQSDNRIVSQSSIPIAQLEEGFSPRRYFNSSNSSFWRTNDGSLQTTFNNNKNWILYPRK